LGGDEMKPLSARDRRHSVSNAFSNYVFTQGRRKQCEAAGAAISKGHFIFLDSNIC
jgi:hypothetical protein